MGVSEIRGTLLGSLDEWDPTVWGSNLGVPYFRKPPYAGSTYALNIMRYQIRVGHFFVYALWNDVDVFGVGVHVKPV